jgi:hypothetical protein
LCGERQRGADRGGAGELNRLSARDQSSGYQRKNPTRVAGFYGAHGSLRAFCSIGEGEFRILKQQDCS